MKTRRSRSAPSISAAVETLEGRALLSGVVTHVYSRAAEVSAESVRAATQTTLAVNAGTLGQPITFTVTVRASARAGSPTGTVEILDHGNQIQSLQLSPTTSANPKYAYSTATYTLTQPPGGSAYFFGKHAVSAQFIPSGTFLKSTGRKTFTVSQPAYTALADGVKIAPIVPGSGAAIQSGQTASVLYSGYLSRNGHLFDDSINDGGVPLPFTLGTGEVIRGFDEGTVGMQVGETRIVLIPPAEGYGSTGSPPAIPRNAALVFVLTLESIS